MNLSIPHFTFAILFLSLTLFSQESNLEEQFDQVYEQSSNYQEYKVIKKAGFLSLKESVSDSIAVYREALAQMQSEIESQNMEMELLRTELANTRSELEDTLSAKNSVSVLGMQIEKTTFTVTVVVIILLLLFLVFLFGYHYKTCNKTTTELKQKLQESELEYEQQRARSLEREQNLKRQLLDANKKHIKKPPK